MPHTIKLYKTEREFVAVFSDPQVSELFGTDTLPTAFTAAADPAEVLASIRGLNPDCRVTWNGVLVSSEVAQ